MSNKGPVDRMKALIPSLPERDIELANKFLNNRDFESLQLLVNSAIVRVEKGLNKKDPKKEYLKADLEKMDELKVEVDLYCDALELTEGGEYNQDYY